MLWSHKLITKLVVPLSLILLVIVPINSLNPIHREVNAADDAYMWELKDGKFVSGDNYHALIGLKSMAPAITIQVNNADKTVKSSNSRTFSDKLTMKDSFGVQEFPVTINGKWTMTGTYSSTAGMQGQYAYECDYTVTGRKTGTETIHFSINGAFTGPKGLAEGNYTITFGPGTGTRDNKSFSVKTWMADFTVYRSGGERPPGPLVNSLPPLKGEPIAFIKTIEGKGTVYVSNESEEIPPSQRKWVKATAGMPLGDGYTIRTGSDAETVFTYSSGAVVRAKSVTWFSMKNPQATQTGLSTYYGRLFKGLGNFYFPKGAKAERKFGVETNMAVTSIKGTNFVLEEMDTSTTVRVLEGSVEFKHKATGKSTIVDAGSSVKATANGLSQKTTFNLDQEKAKWTDLSDLSSTPADTSGGEGKTEKKIRIGLPRCFIATAAYGSEMAPELDTLRAFRDKVLMQSEPGKALVNAYYFLSPPLAQFIAEREHLRALVRQVLDPIVSILKQTQYQWN